VTLRHAKECALTAALFAVLLMLYAHILYYVRHGGL
jgi:hypothetical protein